MFTQYFWWISRYLPINRNLQVVGVAAICWALWKLRNRACFEKKLIRSPDEIVCYACAFLRHWAGLHAITRLKWLTARREDKKKRVGSAKDRAAKDTLQARMKRRKEDTHD
ncbi:hypothetical protein BRADI_2g15172v3 [Brachypodium distachyon]|uniref:Uncharacterized protein n=1 Tax=Brachypodium distachyon TaxID=15368 RepID=A0A0Q3QT48_BRADI|nr:hypothetical protein BRADI_2g15172v3 [Brachypodium distachyon]